MRLSDDVSCMRSVEVEVAGAQGMKNAPVVQRYCACV